MDPLQQKINTEQSNILDNILEDMDPSLVQGYKKFMHEVIIQGIVNHNLTMETINHYLLDLHKDVTQTVIGNAINYYEMHAPPKYKYPLSYGN